MVHEKTLYADRNFLMRRTFRTTAWLLKTIISRELFINYIEKLLSQKRISFAKSIVVIFWINIALLLNGPSFKSPLFSSKKSLLFENKYFFWIAWIKLTFRVSLEYVIYLWLNQKKPNSHDFFPIFAEKDEV